MPGRRCVVQGCNNIPNLEGGISVHIYSPKNKSARDKWARFVRTHRANFNPRGRFMVCSEHFAEECFERSLHVEGSQRTLRPGSVPSIWMNKNSEEPPTSRSVRTRKKVSTCFLLFWYIFISSITFKSVVFLIFKCNLVSYFASRGNSEFNIIKDLWRLEKGIKMIDNRELCHSLNTW